MRRFVGRHFRAIALIFLSSVAAYTPWLLAADETELPALEYLREGTEQFESRIQNLSVKVLSIEKFYQRNPKGNRGRRAITDDELVDRTDNVVANWEVESTGRSWHKESIRRAAFDPDEARIEAQSNLQSVFDGKRCIVQFEPPGERGVFGFPRNVKVSIRSGDGPLIVPYAWNEVVYGMSPLAFTVRHSIHGMRDRIGMPISQFLSSKGATVVGKEMREEGVTWIVEVPDPHALGNRIYKEQLWICPDRDFATVKRRTLVRDLEDPAWHLERELEIIGLNQIEPKVWLPSQVKFQIYGATDAASRELNEIFKSKVMRCSEWKVNQDYPANQFLVERVIEEEAFREIVLQTFNLLK